MNKELVGKRVLIVEDDSAVANIIARYLRRQGADVEVVSESKALCMNGPKVYDIVVADWSAVRDEDVKDLGIPILYVTGAVDLDERPTLTPVLEKPFSFSQLLMKLLALMTIELLVSLTSVVCDVGLPV